MATPKKRNNVASAVGFFPIFISPISPIINTIITTNVARRAALLLWPPLLPVSRPHAGLSAQALRPSCVARCLPQYNLTVLPGHLPVGATAPESTAKISCSSQYPKPSASLEHKPPGLQPGLRSSTPWLHHLQSDRVFVR